MTAGRCGICECWLNEGPAVWVFRHVEFCSQTCAVTALRRCRDYW